MSRSKDSGKVRKISLKNIDELKHQFKAFTMFQNNIILHIDATRRNVEQRKYIVMPLKAPEYVISSFARFQLHQVVLILLIPVKPQT